MVNKKLGVERVTFKGVSTAPISVAQPSVAQLVGHHPTKRTVARNQRKVAKGRGFDSQSGHTPGLQVQPWSGCLRETTDQCFSLMWMLSLFLPPFSSL